MGLVGSGGKSPVRSRDCRGLRGAPGPMLLPRHAVAGAPDRRDTASCAGPTRGRMCGWRPAAWCPRAASTTSRAIATASRKVSGQMFSLAYVILPVSDTLPAEAIRASLARFQRGRRGELPEAWVAFHDETDEIREAHEARFEFTDNGTRGMRIGGDGDTFHIDTGKVREEMKRRGVRHWAVRFADEMGLDEFFDRFGSRSRRDPDTGAFGRWLNPLGKWDWWDLGGGFDGTILGERQTGEGRPVSMMSSGPGRGRTILGNIQNALSDALGQEPSAPVEVANDRNIEMVATLLGDAREGRANAYPAAILLPPGAVEDRLRWLGTWPELGPWESFAWLGLAPEAAWEDIVQAAYRRFRDHWAAAIAYHH